MNHSDSPAPVYQPVFVNARREATIVFFVWVAALGWSVPYCYLNGYGKAIDPDNLNIVWGMPSWVFWGVFVPWMIANIFTIAFCFLYMQDDDLGEAHEGADLAEEIAEMHAAHPHQSSDA
jgi:hypothetical protein